MDRNNLVGTRGTVVLFPPGQEDLFSRTSKMSVGPTIFLFNGHRDSTDRLWGWTVISIKCQNKEHVEPNCHPPHF